MSGSHSLWHRLVCVPHTGEADPVRGSLPFWALEPFAFCGHQRAIAASAQSPGLHCRTSIGTNVAGRTPRSSSNKVHLTRRRLNFNHPIPGRIPESLRNCVNKEFFVTTAPWSVIDQQAIHPELNGATYR